MKTEVVEIRKSPTLHAGGVLSGFNPALPANNFAKNAKGRRQAIVYLLLVPPGTKMIAGGVI